MTVFACFFNVWPTQQDAVSAVSLAFKGASKKHDFAVTVSEFRLGQTR